MNLSEALHLINEHHPDGAVEFYAKMKDDPWSRAHEALNSELKTRGCDVGVAVQAFYAEIRRLQDLYRNAGHPVKAHPATIGLHSNTETQVAQRFATQAETCVYCGTTKKLMAIRIEEKLTPCCKDCRAKRQNGEQLSLY